MGGNDPLESMILAMTVLGACCAIAAAYGVRVARLGRISDPRLGRVQGSPLVPPWLVESVYWGMRAPGAWLARAGVSPDALTYTSLVVTCTTLPAAATGRFPLAGALLLVGASFDALDGMVARARGQASAAGALLDSFVDRCADAAPLLGLALFWRGDALALGVTLAALLGSSLVSYARARAEALGLDLPSGLMRRHERIVYLAAGLIFGPLLTRRLPPLRSAPREGGTLLAVALIAALSTIAAVLLVARARRLLADVSAERAAPHERRPGRERHATS